MGSHRRHGGRSGRRGFLPWTRQRYFDRRAFEADLERLRQFYRDNGYPDARVVSFDADVSDVGSIALTLEIDEGEPVIVEAVRLEGFDGIPPEHLDRLRSELPLQAGLPRKRAAILASHDLALRELQDHGFAHAVVDTIEEPASRQGRVVWTVVGRPGPHWPRGCRQRRLRPGGDRRGLYRTSTPAWTFRAARSRCSLCVFELRGFGSDGGGPTVRVGEQIGEKVFVSLQQGFGAQEVTQFMLEYQLNEFLRLKGSIAEGSGGRANRALARRVERSGIDLVLRIRY